jgi:hypothetical protein
MGISWGYHGDTMGIRDKGYNHSSLCLLDSAKQLGRRGHIGRNGKAGRRASIKVTKGSDGPGNLIRQSLYNLALKPF